MVRGADRGETVALDYYARGRLLGEVGLDGNYAKTKAYRKVQGMSERGQVTEQRLGNCVLETGEYDPSTGATLGLTALRPWPSPANLPPTDLAACPAPGSATQALVRQDAYLFDRFMNLKRQTKNVAGSQREERFTYDALQRLTKATLCTGANCTPTTEVVDYAYDDLGNLTKKTDYGTSYLYGMVSWNGQTWVRSAGNAGPHAVRQVMKAAVAGGGVVDFTYDANGNLIDGDGRQIDFDLMDRPVRVQMGGAETEFAYGPTGGRYRQKLSGAPGPGFGPKTVYYVDKDYELTVWDTGSAQPGALEERTFIGPSVTVLTKRSAAGVVTKSVRYRHVDRLGSPDADTADDVGATLVEAHGFDAWGKPRDGNWMPNGDLLHPSGEPGSTSTRGFTGHEHLDATYLIHMNGRVYDYRLGRFLSVDPIISNPANSQSINPYSYIGNNPLSGTDPTGYCAEGTSAESGSRICRQQDPVTQIKNQIGDALSKGAITLKTSMDDAKKTLGEGFSKLVDTVKSMVSPSSGGGTTTPQPGVTPNNVNSPTQVAVGNAQPAPTPGQQQSAPPQAPGAAPAPAAATGRPVYAIADGTVAAVRWQDPNNENYQLGYYIRVQVNPTTTDDYGHTTPDGAQVGVGDHVVAGQQLTTIAVPTNGDPTGPHVHVGRRVDGVSVPIDCGNNRPVGPGGNQSSGWVRDNGGIHNAYDFVYPW